MGGNQKNLSVETLRGIAIILVVMGHVIGSKSSGGMRVGDDSIYRYLYCLLENIRMPSAPPSTVSRCSNLFLDCHWLRSPSLFNLLILCLKNIVMSYLPNAHERITGFSCFFHSNISLYRVSVQISISFQAKNTNCYFALYRESTDWSALSLCT